MQEINLSVGIKGQIQTVVEPSETAIAYKSGMVEVYATPAMIKLMEQTCMESVSNYIPEEYSTVGTKISVTHERASISGMKVVCESELIEVDRKRLVFSVKALDDEGVIGRGTHERFIIDKVKFMEKFEK